MGAVLLTATLAVVVVGPLVTPYSPTQVAVAAPNLSPSADHWLGTDWLGRDVFSRFLAGGREVLLLPFIAVVFAYVVGGMIGIYATLRGGWVDAVIARGFNLLLVLPPMLLGLVVLGAAGSSRLAMGGLLALVSLPRAGRVIRGAAQTVAGSEYVMAAVGRGEHSLYIVRRELLPNIALPVLADLGVNLTYQIIFASSLSFLGFGAQPPTADWGRMVADSIPMLTTTPLAALVPAVGIALAAISVNLLAEALAQRLGGNRGTRLGRGRSRSVISARTTNVKAV
ncbi:ABC transporter permease [Dactylosporangium roseum]|uniref:ABC transporter permease n=1 Tax=Dactylosporangium roseum TaxID=47989 RepID=A0ABY5ZCX4_9ACTN|nr:ABC transporter permease [Dactylosporangium roseum]UWZ39722.1 ABC transporter permease [Dactylosporangium roseum]